MPFLSLSKRGPAFARNRFPAVEREPRVLLMISSDIDISLFDEVERSREIYPGRAIVLLVLSCSIRMEMERSQTRCAQERRVSKRKGALRKVKCKLREINPWWKMRAKYRLSYDNVRGLHDIVDARVMHLPSKRQSPFSLQRLGER